MSKTQNRKLRGKHYYQLKAIKQLMPDSPKAKVSSWEEDIHQYNKSFFRSLDVHARACCQYKILANTSSTAIITFRQIGLKFEYELRPKDFSKFTSRGVEVMLGRLINQLYVKKVNEPTDDDYVRMKALLRLRSVTRHVAETIVFE